VEGADRPYKGRLLVVPEQLLVAWFPVTEEEKEIKEDI
jgi:hypothetical protein